MNFTSCIRVWFACARLMAAMVLLCGVAVAGSFAPPGVPKNECPVNVEHMTFGDFLSTQLSLFEGGLECVNLVLDNEVFPFPAFTVQQMENRKVGDRLVFFNANDGPGGKLAANVCVFSDGGGSTCAFMGKEGGIVNGEMLSSGKLVDGIMSSGFTVYLYSDGDPGAPGGPCPANSQLSDCAWVVSEPSSLALLVPGIPGFFALWARRRVTTKVS